MYDRLLLRLWPPLSAYVSIRQHTSYVRIRQHTLLDTRVTPAAAAAASCFCIRLHTSAYVRIRVWRQSYTLLEDRNGNLYRSVCVCACV